MGKWFVTGDCHGNFNRIIQFIQKFNLGEDDHIIVCGDMGLYWRKDMADAKENIKTYEAMCHGVQLWWVDGNHENFDIINKLKENDMIECSPHITYMGRGVCMDTEIGTMLFMGGADSVDKFWRTEHLTWWADERITEDDIAGIRGHFDFVFSHACPYSVFKQNKVQLCTLNNINENNAIHESEKTLEQLRVNITYNYWFFGHYHVDKHMWPTRDMCQERCVYNDFVEINMGDPE